MKPLKNINKIGEQFLMLSGKNKCKKCNSFKSDQMAAVDRNIFHESHKKIMRHLISRYHEEDKTDKISKLVQNQVIFGSTSNNMSIASNISKAYKMYQVVFGGRSSLGEGKTPAVSKLGEGADLQPSGQIHQNLLPSRCVPH